jgi:hypothetical protein
MSTQLFAVLYDLVMWPAERFCLGRLRRELLSTAGGRILEVGAGTGANLPYYAGGVHLVLSEPDSAMLRRARLAGLRFSLWRSIFPLPMLSLIVWSPHWCSARWPIPPLLWLRSGEHSGKPLF